MTTTQLIAYSRINWLSLGVFALHCLPCLNDWCLHVPYTCIQCIYTQALPYTQVLPCMRAIIDDLCTHKYNVGESLGTRLQMLYQLIHRGSSAGQAKSLNVTKAMNIQGTCNSIIILSLHLGVAWGNCMCNGNVCRLLICTCTCTFV